MTFDDERFQNKNVEVRRWSCTIEQSYFVSYSLCAIAFVSSFPFLFLFFCCCCCCLFFFFGLVGWLLLLFFFSANCFLSITYRYIFLNHLMKYIKFRWNYVSSVLAIIVWYNLSTGTCSHDTGPSIEPLHSSVSYLYPSRQTHRYPLFVNPTWHTGPFPGQGFPWSWHKFWKY